MTSDRTISSGQTAAAALATLPCAIAIAMLVAVYLPVPETERIIGSGVAFPLVWVALAVGAFLSRSAPRAWGYLLGTTALASALVALRVLGGV